MPVGSTSVQATATNTGGIAACVPANPLSDGATSVTAVAADAFGNVSDAASVLSFTVIGADVVLDTDGDGVVDSVDTDDDGDGMSDVVEGSGLATPIAAALAGRDVTFEVTVGNSGPSTAPAGSMVFSLPAGLTPISGEFSAAGAHLVSNAVTTPSCAVAGQTRTCDDPALAIRTGDTFDMNRTNRAGNASPIVVRLSRPN
jgi:uncharacterized repeat protein (TIGR01451 family)